MVVNLSRVIDLNNHEISLLEKGLGFIPEIKVKSSVPELQAQVAEYHKRLRVAAFYGDEAGGAGPRKPFMPPSEWEPPEDKVPQVAHIIVDRDTNFLLDLPVGDSGSTGNLLYGEQVALQRFQDDFNVIIKPADKGAVVVVMDRAQYIREAMRQLQDTQYYKKLQKLIYTDSIKIIGDLVDQLVAQGYLNRKQGDYVKGNGTPRPRRFYILPKIHKSRTSWPFEDMPPGRPIVSDCGSESYGIAEYIDHYLNPLARKHSSYIRDTWDFLDKTRELVMDKKMKFFTLDVTSLYTNIETQKGLRAVRDCFIRYPDS
ncbi:MAG: hypothetical protein ACRDDA_00030, partial [Aeromonas sp.]